MQQEVDLIEEWGVVGCPLATSHGYEGGMHPSRETDSVLYVQRLWVQAWSVYESACRQGKCRSTYGLRSAIAIRQPSIDGCKVERSIGGIRAEACEKGL